MSRNNTNWIITAQCPSKLGSVDVVTRFLKEQCCYINEQHTSMISVPDAFLSAPSSSHSGRDLMQERFAMHSVRGPLSSI
ncbi:hypothetical protein [Pantoea wallisii]|uniref:hypothetical protein n=1 Tax=Pantoea wallisii TaxID=1076551 RepID=UPI001FC975A4|nr:hypothetical protein [Pantoea wallisii]